MYLFYFFFFKQKTAYEMRISDWSSDVCSSDLACHRRERRGHDTAAYARSGDNDFAIPNAISHGCLRRGKSLANYDRPQSIKGDEVCAPEESIDGLARCRSVKSRVGKECVSTVRYRGAP